ncbi:DUF2515 family protein [Bacillus coahuilensis]|uniref:DUF2515 family protein n=1 Tax=Bacillus coahuilensis TaxID=408580 RepID=UPI0009D7592F
MQFQGKHHDLKTYYPLSYQKQKKTNKNNVTRTSAYLNFVKKHPEVHWAFLAHMVSRNGGYTMCDLQSFLIRELVTEKEVFPFYLFLVTS